MLIVSHSPLHYIDGSQGIARFMDGEWNEGLWVGVKGQISRSDQGHC